MNHIDDTLGWKDSVAFSAANGLSGKEEGFKWFGTSLCRWMHSALLKVRWLVCVFRDLLDEMS